MKDSTKYLLIGIIVGIVICNIFYIIRFSDGDIRNRFENEIEDFKTNDFLRRQGVTENISVKSGIYIYENHPLARALILGKVNYICKGVRS